MSAGIGFRQRAIESASALTPGYLVEYSRLVDFGMVFKWDASGPLAGMDQFVNALPEFAYLALDDQPVRLYVKRSRPGVRPAVWDRGPAMPDFSLQDLLTSEAASATSAQAAATFAKNSSDSAVQSAASAVQSATSANNSNLSALASLAAQVAARASATLSATSAAQAIALIGAQLPAPVPVVLTALLPAMMALLPTSPPAGDGLPWLDNGVLVFTPATDASNAAAIAAANQVNQTQLNPVMVAALLQGMAAGLPSVPPDGAGQPWLNNGVLTLTS